MLLSSEFQKEEAMTQWIVSGFLIGIGALVGGGYFIGRSDQSCSLSWRWNILAGILILSGIMLIAVFLNQVRRCS